MALYVFITKRCMDDAIRNEIPGTQNSRPPDQCEDFVILCCLAGHEK